MRLFIIRRMMALIACGLVVTSATAAPSSINAGTNQAQKEFDFTVETVAQFNRPWSMAFLPDQGLLITEKPGKLYQLDAQGDKTMVSGVPHVYNQGQNGLLDVALAPDFSESGKIYLSYVAPKSGGGVLTLMRAHLAKHNGGWVLEDAQQLWQHPQPSHGGQPGGIIAFAPSGDALFFSSGDRMQAKFAQVPEDARGKILRLTLDGKPMADNPWADASGIQPTLWTLGHRNPYGLAFDAHGRLWSHEMGPKGGDEFNLIKPGKNYGWPLVSNGDEYDGTPIPDHDSRPELEAPRVYWTPVISPSGLAFYEHDLFADWQGSALIGGLSSQALIRVAFDADGQPDEVQRFAMGSRIRDVGVDADGAIWLLEDGNQARLLKLLPK